MQTKQKIKNYLNNEDLLRELELSHQKGRATETLGKMFELLVERLQYKLFYKNPDIKLDCKYQAVLTLLQNWHKFDATKYDNAFAYFTRVAMNGLSHAWNKNESRPIHIPLSAFVNNDNNDND